QLEDDPGHVGLVWHRLRQPVEVRDADLRALLRLDGERAGGVDLAAGGRDLLVEVGRLGALRTEHEEVAAGREEQEAERDQGDHGGLRESALHEPPPGRRTSATITKWTAFAVPRFVRVLCCSWTLTRSGITATRVSKRATASCEYVKPSIVNSVAAVVLPGALAGGADAVDDGPRPFAPTLAR